MAATTASLFSSLPRRSRRVLMRVVDSGCDRWNVRLKCEKCGHQEPWRWFQTKKECQTQPCPKCNPAPVDGIEHSAFQEVRS